LYAHNNKGKLPPSPNFGNASSSLIYLNPAGRPAQVGYYEGWVGIGLLFHGRALTEPRIFYCPSQNERLFSYPDGWTYISGSGLTRYMSYYYRIFGQLNPGITPEDIAWMRNLTLARMRPPKALTADIFGQFIFGGTWAHLNPYGLNVSFSDGHAEFVDIGLTEYQRASRYNNGTPGGYQNDTIRDPFVFAFWKALDNRDLTPLAEQWP
jgi:hypothetical protein